MNRHTPLVLCTALAIQPLMFGDASYQETTQITGGSLLSMMKMASVFSSRARQAEAPTNSTVMVHQNRMVRVNPLSTEIIDLDHQTITQIDTQKKQYSVMTFAQMQEAMQRASEQMKKSKQQKNSGNDSANVSFNAKVHETGAVKQVDGRDAKEAVMTLSMDATSTDGSNQKGSLAIASDMWLISDAPGYDEIRSFNLHLAQALAADVDTSALTSMLNAQPGAGQAMADMKKEMAKMTGIPVIQVMRMGMTANGEPLPPPSADTTPAPSADGNNQSSDSQKSGGLGRALGGGFGSLMRHKSNQTSQSSDTSNAQNGGGNQPGVLLETSTHRSNFSSGAVDTTSFEVPAGYKQVESPMNRTNK
jgi:predicted acylesterase/phospholipase RssA